MVEGSGIKSLQMSFVHLSNLLFLLFLFTTDQVVRVVRANQVICRLQRRFELKVFIRVVEGRFAFFCDRHPMFISRKASYTLLQVMPVHLI